jgi:hypothetical protein
MSSTLNQHCGQCGFLLPPGSTTCPNCGAPVSAPQPGEATPASNPPSEYFPGMAEQVDDAETLVRMRPEEVWPSQPSGEVSPSSPPPASGTLPTPVQTGPTGPGAQSAPVSGYVAPPQAGPALTPSYPSGGFQQPFGAPPAGPGWVGAPQGSMPTGTGTAPYPGQPFGGAPTAPEMFGAPSQAPYGTPPGAYVPGFGTAPGAPVGGPPPQRTLPLWFTIGAAALIVVGLLLVWITGSDWANGGLHVGIAALVFAGIVLVGFLVGRTQGYRSSRLMSGALAAVLILIVLGAAGIALQGPIHSLQGGAFDNQQNYLSAVSEYKAAGDSLGLARTYNDWGENLLSKKIYSLPDDPTTTATDGALAKFNFVLDPKNGFTQSGDPNIQDQVTRAKNGVVNTILAWGEAHLSQQDYQGAVDRFNLVLNQKDAYVATNNFAQVHRDAAKAYLALGQQQISGGDCTDAVATYQMVAKDYNDTPEGTQASSELKKPQSVTGTVVDFTTQAPVPGVTLYLSSKWSVQSGFFQASNDNVTKSGADGTFKFPNITPGDTKYLISYVDNGRETIVVSAASGQPLNVVVVLPLCGADAGPVPYNLPGA